MLCEHLLRSSLDHFSVVFGHALRGQFFYFSRFFREHSLTFVHGASCPLHIPSDPVERASLTYQAPILGMAVFGKLFSPSSPDFCLAVRVDAIEHVDVLEVLDWEVFDEVLFF